jgi:hypothetical protein
MLSGASTEELVAITSGELVVVGAPAGAKLPRSVAGHVAKPAATKPARATKSVKKPPADDDDDAPDEGEPTRDEPTSDPEDAKKTKRDKKAKKAAPVAKPEHVEARLRRLEAARDIASPVQPFTQASLAEYAKAHAVSLDVAILHMAAGRR